MHGRIMTAGLEARKRRAIFRATHRGTKEMDWMLGRFAHSTVGDMDAIALATFEDLLVLPDPQIQNWVMWPDQNVDLRFEALVRELRGFHGLIDGEVLRTKNETI
ncbi:MAG: succinate dehydrogenase assembly factor 2 [Hyphomicrobiaceae bacterium]